MYRMIVLVTLMLAAGMQQALAEQLVRRKTIYNEQGLTIQYSLYRVGSEEVGAPGNEKVLDTYRNVVTVTNNTGGTVRFRGVASVSFGDYSMAGSGRAVVDFGGSRKYRPGTSVDIPDTRHSWILDERYRRPGEPRWHIPSWTVN